MSETSAYEALHARIVAGELSPGERLVEEELAEQLGESRGAIRTALLRLEHDRLVIRERNRGARVRRISAEEAVEILEARAALESLAAGYAAERRTDADVKELRKITAEMGKLLAAGELLAISERNARLHRRILEISQHTVAQEICARLNPQMVRFQFRTVLAPGRPSKSLTEHGAIVEAIAAGDRKAAEAAMRRHLSHVAKTLLEMVASERAA
ncbi:GntR family transcriptional regulator [Solirubrobacter soli]|uniref:GntR family transcriptional regulator n=1 Tax=Solirubrobacter soli TaxID=363832 RepID=UPI00041A2D15|nr:GntR family transcriptional regulator [Solirubrobacter soli]